MYKRQDKFRTSNEKFKKVKKSYYRIFGVFNATTEFAMAVMQLVTLALGGVFIMKEMCIRDRVRFHPDPEMFDETVYNYDTLFKRMREQAFLNAGLTIIMEDKRPEQEQRQELCYEGGIREFRCV